MKAERLGDLTTIRLSVRDEMGVPGLGALYGIPARLSQHTVQQVTNATAGQFVPDPVFRHPPETILAGGNQSQSQIDALLARGVPALSGPVGSRSIAIIPHSHNVDLNEMTVGTYWPRTNEPRWSGCRHGDIRAVALPFVFGIFESILGVSPQ